MKSPCSFAPLVSIVLCVASAEAHDFWIEPSSFHPPVGSLVSVRLRLGHHGHSEPVVRDASRIDRFIVAGPRTTRPVPGRDGADPAGLVRADTPGLHVIGYRNKPSFIELQPTAFEHYLRHEGLDPIIALRAQRGETHKPGREIFSRCAKSLVKVGRGTGGGFDGVLGFRLELVPESDPIDGGARVSFRLLFEGQPCPGVLVSAVCRENPANELTARSDDHGRVRFRLHRSGVWFLNAVHMVPAGDTARADWESLWASFTFERMRPEARQTDSSGSTAASSTPSR